MELTRPPVALAAHEHAWSRRLRAHPHLLADMARGAHGPFHVLHPATFADNVRAFQHALTAGGVDGQVMYGKKANKSPCFLTACAATGTGADVASAPELQAALAAGLRGPDLVVTGPAKSTRLLELALRHDALIAVDALDELRRLLVLARRTGRGRALLRVLPDVDPTSRFGLDTAELDEATRLCADSTDLIAMEGFSFHLSGYAVPPRARLAAELVRRCLWARTQGLKATTISIGGGFAVDYVPAQDWQQFLTHHNDTWFHARRRPERFYPYHQQPSGADMLEAILTSAAGTATRWQRRCGAPGCGCCLNPDGLCSTAPESASSPYRATRPAEKPTAKTGSTAGNTALSRWTD